MAHPESLAYISLSLSPSFKKTSGPRPSFSRTPGRKGSINTSAFLISSFSIFSPSGFFRSTAIERFPLLNISVEISWSARSIRTTVAPQSASVSPANGPGASPANYLQVSHPLKIKGNDQVLQRHVFLPVVRTSYKDMAKLHSASQCQ